MMFTVKTEEAEQRRLADPIFIKFVNDTTGCEIIKIDNATTGETVYQAAPGCLQFIMARSFEEMSRKSKEVAKLLRSQSNIDQAACNSLWREASRKCPANQKRWLSFSVHN